MTDSRNHKPFIAGFIGDQTPVKNEIQYWTKFLNQDTPVLLGTEKLAKKTNSVVVAVHMKKVKRGYYTVMPVLITDKPTETEQFEITEAQITLIVVSVVLPAEPWL